MSLLCFLLIFEQSGFAQVAGSIDISGHLSSLRNSFVQDKFRPIHLRSLGYDSAENAFRLLLDKGDQFAELNKLGKLSELNKLTKQLFNYFLVGLSLPNNAFWVNLRPDSPDNIIDPYLAQTDVGKILLEADLQLKKDTASFTSPETPQGKEYWDKLYQKAGELLGYENITIPTITRPWIVPGEIIIRETAGVASGPEQAKRVEGPSAYIYKATLKVMLEQDYLKDSATYNFDDPRLKTLNEYSSQLIRDLIIPKLTKEVNTSKRYAALRQVYYSLILAQWFKARQVSAKANPYAKLIDSRNLTNLESKTPWSKTTYFKAYQKSFKTGEYNIQQPVYTPYGQTIRSYFSGGISGFMSQPQLTRELSSAIGTTGNQAVLPAATPITASPILSEYLLPMDNVDSLEIPGLIDEVGIVKIEPSPSSFWQESDVYEAMSFLSNGNACETYSDPQLLAAILAHLKQGVNFKKKNEAGFVQEMVELFKKNNIKNILEIGTSDGRLLGALYEVAKLAGVELYGVDLTVNRDRQAWLKEKEIATLLEGDARNLKKIFPDKKFDIIFSVGVLTSGGVPSSILFSADGKNYSYQLAKSMLEVLSDNPKAAIFNFVKYYYFGSKVLLNKEDIDKLESAKVIYAPFKNTELFGEVADVIILGKKIPFSHSPLLTEKKIKEGGIDFRSLPIVTQAISNLSLNISPIPLSSLDSINLNQEWLQIQKMVGAGITPSSERIREYIQVSCLKGELNDTQKVISCIADILRLEEERCFFTEPMLKNILIVLESGRTARELKAVFTGGQP